MLVECLELCLGSDLIMVFFPTLPKMCGAPPVLSHDTGLRDTLAGHYHTAFEAERKQEKIHSL